jgi:hypothetical protein
MRLLMLMAALIWLSPAGAWAMSPPAQDAPAPQGQSANGGKPQKVDAGERTRKSAGKEHWNDGMNTKASPDPGKRDEYGAPAVTAPRGQGTDNAGGIPHTGSVAPKASAGDRGHGR